MQSTDESEQGTVDSGDKERGSRSGGEGAACAFCQDDDEVMMCPLCSCRACYGKQDPSLALLCEVNRSSLRVEKHKKKTPKQR